MLTSRRNLGSLRFSSGKVVDRQRLKTRAITDNKRLGAVLEHIKEMQDKAPPKYPVRTNSEKMGYKPNGKRPGRPSGSCTKKSIVQAAK